MTSSFNASIGTKVLLEVEGNPKRFGCILVGYSKDKFILVTTPVSENLFSARPALFADYRIKVRYIDNGRAIGFQSRLIKTTDDPARLLFLAYPDNIEDHELRTVKRAPCALPAEVKIDEMTCGSLIVDINEIGLRIQIKNSEECSAFLDPTPVGMACALQFFLPGIAQPLSVSGEIRNYERRDQCRALGIKFTDIADEDKRNIIEFESKLMSLN